MLTARSMGEVVVVVMVVEAESMLEAKLPRKESIDMEAGVGADEMIGWRRSSIAHCRILKPTGNNQIVVQFERGQLNLLITGHLADEQVLCTR